MVKAIKNQMNQLLQRKTVILAWLLICGFVLMNFFTNVIRYEGSDLIEMYQPMQLLFLRDYGSAGPLLIQALPILIVILSGFSYFEDKTVGVELFSIARMGAGKYYFSKIAAVFFVNMVIFTIPLLLEVPLNMIAFPLEATGYLDNQSMYAMMDNIKDALFIELYAISPYLHAAFSILMFGIWTGLLGAFIVAISFLPVIRFRLLLFLPLYMVIQLLEMICQNGLVTVQTYYGFYFYILDGSDLSESGYWGMMGIFIAIILGITFWKSGRDCRNR